MGKFILSSLIFILAFHFLAGFLSWYHAIWWLDIPMHLIGGAWVASLFFYLFNNCWKILPPKGRFFPTLILCLGFVALVGVLWEFYEYLADVFINKTHPFFIVNDTKLLFDTLKDILNDLIGGVFVAIIFLFNPPVKSDSVDKSPK